MLSKSQRREGDKVFCRSMSCLGVISYEDQYNQLMREYREYKNVAEAAARFCARNRGKTNIGNRNNELLALREEIDSVRHIVLPE